MNVRTLLGIALSLTACADSVTAPRRIQPVPVPNSDHQAMLLTAASELEAYVAQKQSSASPLTLERRDELIRMVRDARNAAQPPEFASTSETVETSSEAFPAGYEVEQVGAWHSWWTDLDLRQKKVTAQSAVKWFPAVLDFDMSGSTTVGGFSYPIESSKSTSPFPVWWFLVATDLNGGKLRD